MTKITLKIERDYGNEDLKAIMEALVSKKLLEFKFNNKNKNNDKPYHNIDKTDNCKERSKS